MTNFKHNHTLRRAALTLLALIMTCAAAWANTETVTYIDADGNTQTVTATVLTGSEDDLGTSGQTTWYVVNSNISHNGEIECNGDVRLILADGNTLTVNSGDDHAVFAFPSLTIYGQALGTGTLSASNTSNSYSAIKASNTLTISGGNVSASNTSNSSSVHVIDADYITISGGTVNVSGAGTAINAYNTLTISDGTVTDSSTSSNAIYAIDITISGGTVNVSEATTAIKASNTLTISGGNVSVTDDQIGIYSSGGTITINGGNITATGNGYGIYSDSGTITINGGTVSINSNDIGISSNGAITINGGKVTATGNGYGIFSPSRTITLRWTNSDDFIMASSYNGTVTIAPYKPFTDGTNTYTGTLDAGQVEALANQTLQPVVPAFTNSGDGTPEHPYTIYNATGWGEFCDMLDNFDHNTSGGYCFDGKTVKLDADISITRAAGNTSYHDFTGIFDGQGHTLTVNITDTQNQGTAPFRVISNGAIIRNLHVTGTVTGTTHAAGLVGKACAGTMLIENCLVETNVNSTVGSNRHCGGIVGHGFGNNQNPNNVNLTLRNCVYAGTITCDQNYIGGLQGWSDGNTLTLERCLFAGNYQGTGSGTAAFHPIALHNTGKTTNATTSNVFYTMLPTVADAYIAATGIKTTGRATVPAGLGNAVATTYSFTEMTVYENGILYNGLYYAAPTLSTDNDNAYLINNADDWLYFCEMLNDNDTWNRFSGQTVKLTASIGTTESPVTRLAGYSGHDFCGTFDGQGNTLTFSSTENVDGVAPFSYISETSETSHPAIRNLNVVVNINTTATHASGLVGRQWGTLTIEDCTVSGTITTSAKYAAGFIGEMGGSANITNCLSSVTISSSVSGDGTHGGFVAAHGNTLNIEGCVFNGSLLGASTHSCGGFVGWKNGTVNISNSLFAPASVSIGSSSSATFSRNGVNSISNSYYITAFGDAQGTQRRSVTAGQNVTTCSVSPVGNSTATYDVSDITAYNKGLIRGSNFYFGNTDVVSLTLDHAEVPEGYIFNGYTASAGTLTGNETDGYSLTMPDNDVTICASMVGPISLSPASATISLGATQTLTATINVSGTPTITYTSSNTNVATVTGSGTTATVTGVAPGTATITATMNYNGADYTASSTITIEELHACTPTFSGSYTEYYISNFTTTGATTNINNTTNGTGLSYSDYYDTHSVSAHEGQTINFTITIAGGSGHMSAIWVDWNNDLEFSDAEKVHQTAFYAYSPHNSSFTVPTGATLGDHRMRVVAVHSNTFSACSAKNGEFEDYKLTVIAAPIVTGLALSTDGATMTATWDANANATSYNISINGNVTPNATTTNSYTWNVNLSTTYTVMVEANFAGGETSGYCDPVSATTPDCLGGHVINYTLTDLMNDGWEGSSITIIDGCGNIIQTLRVAKNASPLTGTLSLCGSYFKFVYTQGDLPSHYGWTFTEGGTTLFTGNGSNLATGDMLYTIGTFVPAPTNLTAGTPGANSVVLNWTAGGSETSWQICINGDETNLTMASTNVGYILSGLYPETNYTVKVRAINGNSQSCWSNAVSFTTLAGIDLTVTGYGTGNDKWVFIASPVSGSIAPDAVGNLLGTQISTNPVLYDYDLYRFNQSASSEWENYHAHTEGFVLENGKGYLYATKQTKTLVFTGNITSTTEPVEVSLAYSTDNTDVSMRGWNLVGNPFAVDAYVNRPFYQMNAEGTGIEAVNNYTETIIPPCTGIMVQATGENETIKFGTSSPVTAPYNGGLSVTLTQANTRGNALLDNAIVSFNEDSQLGKFYFGTQDANIYIPQSGEEYAIAYSEGQGETPLNFKAAKSGTYTLSVNTEGVELAYLHLIDNMTGADVDLLAAGPSTGSGASYTFTAKTTDYESRFKLVFVANDEETGSTSFAFYSNGNWIISNEGRATMQVIDVTGRILSSEEIHGSVSKAIHAAPGVYMIRLINGEDVKVQKVVVR